MLDSAGTQERSKRVLTVQQTVSSLGLVELRPVQILRLSVGLFVSSFCKVVSVVGGSRSEAFGA